MGDTWPSTGSDTKAPMGEETGTKPELSVSTLQGKIGALLVYTSSSGAISCSSEAFSLGEL